MKKFLRSLLIIVLTLALVPLALTACAKEPHYGLINGDFTLRDEDGLRVIKETQGGFNTYEFWTGEDSTLPYGYEYYAHHESSTYKLDRDPPFNRDGRNYFEFKHTVRSYSYLTQKINVKPQSYYQLQLSYRTLGTSSIGNLCFYIGEDPTISPSRVSGDTGLNVTAWKSYSIFISSNQASELTLYIAFGGTGADLFGVDTNNNAAVGSNLDIYGAIGTAQITDIILTELPAAPNSSNIHSVNLNRNNILTNYDMRKRDENGSIISTGNGYYELSANEDGTPIGWSFVTNNSDAAYLIAATETAETVQISGTTVTYNSKNNYFKIKHNELTFSTVYQTVSVKPRTYYLLNYNYYIPQNQIHFGQSGYISNYGLHLAFLEDPLYILNSKVSNEVLQQNHYAATSSKSISRWVQSPSFTIYSGDNTTLRVGVNFGLADSPVRGEAWVTSLLMRETVPSSEAYIYYIQNNNGYGQNTALETILLILFILITVVLFALSIWAIYFSLSKKQAKQPAAEIPTEPPTPSPSTDLDDDTVDDEIALDENQKLDALLSHDAPTESTELVKGVEIKEPSKILTLLKKVGDKAKDFIKTQSKNPLVMLTAIIAVGFLIRLCFSFATTGYRESVEQTINSILLIKNSGYSGYITATQKNHMPLYSIILWLFSFMLPSNANLVSFEHILLIKLPTMLADCLTAFVMYKFGKKQSQRLGLTMAAIYVLNPLLIINSVILRYDTLFILFVALSFYFLLNKNMIGLFACYTLSVMTDIYALAFAPAIVSYLVVQIVSAIMRMIKNKEGVSGEGFATLIMLSLFILSSAVIFYMSALALSFSALRGDFVSIINYYFMENLTIGHFSFNGLNIFTMIGLNGVALENMPTTIILLVFFVLLTVLCALLYIKNRNRAQLILIAAFAFLIISVIFVNVSDAFILPLIALLTAALALFKDKRLLFILFSVSLLGFINMFMVMQSANYLNTMPAYLLNPNINALYKGTVLIKSGIPFIQSILAAALLVVTVAFYFVLNRLLFTKNRVLFETSKPHSFKACLKDYFGITTK